MSKVLRDMLDLLTFFLCWMIVIIMFSGFFITHSTSAPEFKITKEEWLGEIRIATIAFNQKPSVADVPNPEIMKLSSCAGGTGYDNKWFCDFKKKIYVEVEVESMEIWSNPVQFGGSVECSSLTPGGEEFLASDGFFCKDGIVQRLELLLREDLTTVWLNENAKCLGGHMDEMCVERSSLEEIREGKCDVCGRWQIDDYKIEVKG